MSRGTRLTNVPAAVAPAGEPGGGFSCGWDLGRPVAMATVRAGMLRDDMVKTAEQLSEQLGRAVAELRTLSDPDAAAAQVETVAAESAQQVAAAEVARNRAEATARQAQFDLAEANDAAQALDDQLQQTSIARAESDRLHFDALAAATATVQALTGDLATRTGERDQLQTRVDELTRELAGRQHRPGRRPGPSAHQHP